MIANADGCESGTSGHRSGTMKSPGVIEPMTGVSSALVIELVKAD